jgi:hypothetical protein
MYAEASGSFIGPGSIQTGVAVANAGTEGRTVTFELTRLDGSPSGLTGALSLPARGQRALFLNQIPGFESLVSPFRGVLRISAGGGPGIAVAALRGRYNERGDFLMAATPPVDESNPFTAEEFLFPHFADGAGYTTQFVVFAGSSTPISSGSLWLFDQTGKNLMLGLANLN